MCAPTLRKLLRTMRLFTKRGSSQVPLLAPISMRVHPLRMILLGASVSSVSPFFLAAGHTSRAAALWRRAATEGIAC